METRGPEITLTRFASTPMGTLGRLGPFAVLEEEWQMNKPKISAIPTGTYRCVRSYFHRGGYETFEVLHVPNRSEIKFHVGNTEEDTEGCPLLGSNFGVLAVQDEDSGLTVNKIGVVRSRPAFQRFMDSLEGINEFTLHVVEH